MANPVSHNATIGIIGLGLVGSALANLLRESEYTLVGYDTDAGKTAAFVAGGGHAVDTPAAVADHCERIIFSLPNSTIVRQVIDGRHGMLCARRMPTDILDTTTGDPDETVAVAELLAQHGIAYLDATISGSSEQISCRTATIMVGGPAEAFDRNRDLLTVFSDRVYHLGPSGSGSRMKLASNLVLGLNRAVLAEGFVFAERLGLDLSLFLEVLKNSPAYSKAMDVKGQQMLEGDFTPASRIRQHLKDVTLICEYAQRSGQLLPFSAVHQELLTRAVVCGDGELDNAAVIREIRRKTADNGDHQIPLAQDLTAHGSEMLPCGVSPVDDDPA